jgi:hypothetical protein
VVPSEKKGKEEKGYKSISATLSHQSKWEILSLLSLSLLIKNTKILVCMY